VSGTPQIPNSTLKLANTTVYVKENNPKVIHTQAVNKLTLKPYKNFKGSASKKKHSKR